MKLKCLMLGVFCAAASVMGAEIMKAPAAKGPATSVEDFFGKCIDCSIPELSEIPAKMSAGDTAAANKIFADYVRKSLAQSPLRLEWEAERPSSRRMRQITEAARKTMSWRVAPCGIPHQFEPGKIDWEANPTYNGYREWPWQLGRHNFLTDLAHYYVTVKPDARAAETWRDMIASWIAQAVPPPASTPPGATITWRTLDAGLRVKGWCRQIAAFASSPAISDEFIVTFFRSVCDHARRLEPSRTTNNWRLMELGGLARVAVSFPFLSRSSAWLDLATKEYEQQLKNQLYPDGFQFELTPGYHGTVPEFCGEMAKLLLNKGIEPSKDFMDGIERSYALYARLSRPDGYTPPLNDSGEVKVSAKLRQALELFPNNKMFQWFATGGKEGTAPEFLSYAFPYAGAVTFRSDWSGDAVWGYMDCSPFGRSHQHEDKLNFLLSAYGKKMVVEAGIYDYDSSEMRKYVLSTRSHNTILIDGKEQNTRCTYRWHPADINKKADFKHSFTPSIDMAQAKYTNGYGPAKSRDMTTHERTLLFFKHVQGLPPFFVCIDILKAPDKRERSYDLLWHLEESKLAITGTSFTADFGNGIRLTATFSDDAASIVDMKGSHAPYQGWMPIRPSGPHEHRPIPTPVLKGRFTGAKRIVSVLCPYKEANPIAGVSASENPDDTGFTLLLKDGKKICL